MRIYPSDHHHHHHYYPNLNVQWNNGYSPPILITLIILISFLSGNEVDAGINERHLINHLLAGYNPLERPVANETDTLNLTFGITLQQIIDVDEKNQILISNLWLKFQWVDIYLRWNPEDYGGITDLRISTDRIWIPDVLMYNSADERFDSTFRTNVVVYHNGSCLYVPPGVFKSTCRIDITWFPFDDQKCDLKFGSWTYDGFSVDLQQEDSFADTSPYMPNGEWVLMKVPSVRTSQFYECCPAPYIDITFTIHMKRRTLYYGFNLIIPCIILSSMTLLSFSLPPESGEKLHLGVTILLSMTVFLVQLGKILPATSDSVSIIAIYFGSIMVMVAFSVVMTVVVLNFHHRSSETKEMGPKLKTLLLNWLPRMLRMDRPGIKPPKKCIKKVSSSKKLAAAICQTVRPDLCGNNRDEEEEQYKSGQLSGSLSPNATLNYHVPEVFSGTASVCVNVDSASCGLRSNDGLLRLLHHQPPSNGAMYEHESDCIYSRHANSAMGGKLFKLSDEPTDRQNDGTNNTEMDFSIGASGRSQDRPREHQNESGEHDGMVDPLDDMDDGNSKLMAEDDDDDDAVGTDNDKNNTTTVAVGDEADLDLDISLSIGSEQPTQLSKGKFFVTGMRSRSLNDKTRGRIVTESGLNGHIGKLSARSTPKQVRLERRNKGIDTKSLGNSNRPTPCAHNEHSGPNQQLVATRHDIHHEYMMLKRKHKLLEILLEMRFITDRLRQEDQVKELIAEWRYAATVLDRLCLIIFTLFTVLSLAICLISAPQLIV